MIARSVAQRKKGSSSWKKWVCQICVGIAMLVSLFYLYSLALSHIGTKSKDDMHTIQKNLLAEEPVQKISETVVNIAISPPEEVNRPTKSINEPNKSLKDSHEKEDNGEEDEDAELSSIEQQNVNHRSDTNAEQLSVFDRVQHTLSQHPLHSLTEAQKRNFSFVDYFVYVKSVPQCTKFPLYVSMANVFSDLYWQLIENFIYTMVKFDLSDCAVMICVSDPRCMQRCRDSNFPCVDFQYATYHPEKKELPHTLEQIGELKLYHIPRALDRGVDMIMLDLDVGFLSDPRHLLDGTKQRFDAYVQKDIAYVMNRTQAGWRTWFTVPLPNIGIMYVKANKKTVRMFDDAWAEYKTIDKPIKHNPGKDQNKVAGAMQRGWSYGFHWAFFPAGSAILLDMMYKFNDPRYELGGLAADDLFTVTGTNDTAKVFRLSEGRRSKRHAMSRRTQDVGLSNGNVYAVHTTCYEQNAKIHGLKAANAYWNPYYYTANRRTLTKPLVYITEQQLRHEVRTLVYLAHVTNRSLIIPNILGNDERLVELDTYRDRTLWPGFRVLYQRKATDIPKTAPKTAQPHDVKILEPAYYWRIQRDYFMGSASKLVPEPVVVPLFRRDPAFLLKHNLIPAYTNKPQRNDLSIADIEAILQSPEFRDQPRLVLSVLDKQRLPSQKAERVQYIHEYQKHLRNWAKDSVGDYRSYVEELRAYGELPRLTDRKATEGIQNYPTARYIIDNTRLCRGMFEFDRGNRSCFDKCK